MARNLKDNGQFVVFIAGTNQEDESESGSFFNFLSAGLAIAIVMMVFASLLQESEQNRQPDQSACQKPILSRTIDDLVKPCPVTF